MSRTDISRQRHWVCARQIAERRRSLGLTQQDVVERLAELGVHATNRSLSAMEHGQGLDVGRLPELAVALDCTVTYLLGLTADPSSWAPDDAVRDEPVLATRVPAEPARVGPQKFTSLADEVAQLARASKHGMRA